MTKITLDRETFKALASDTRLDILKVLDGKNIGLNEIAKVTNLNKATLHEHLTKLHEAGLIKRTEREGHKWVYYRLTWKGESLLHPENTRIVVMFSATFVALAVGILNFISYIKGTLLSTMQKTGVAYEYASRSGIENDAMYNDKSIWWNNLSQNVTSAQYGCSYDGSGIISNIPPTNVPPHSLFIHNETLRNFLWKNAYGNQGGFDYSSPIVVQKDTYATVNVFYQDPVFLTIALSCFIIFSIVLCFSLWRYQQNKTPKL